MPTGRPIERSLPKRWADPVHASWEVLTRMDSIVARFFASPGLRLLVVTLYYLAIIAGLVWLYGKGDFSTPSFIYQNF